MKFSTEILPYILIQRPTVPLLPESLLLSQFQQHMESDFFTFKAFLPASLTAMLDIGCGVGGMDVLISEHYNNNIEVFLIDKTEITPNITYGYKDAKEFYNSLEATMNFLKLNNVHAKYQEATDDYKINFDVTFDLIISTRSWGYHYPVSTYLPEAYDKLSPEGILILDIRENTTGISEVMSKFGNCEVICEDKPEKLSRIYARKVI